MTLRIRRASVDDIAMMQLLERDAAQAFRAVGYDFCADGPVRTYEEHERGLVEGVSFIAEVDGEPSGFILMWPVDGHAHITEVSVSTQFQKRGIGRSLVAAGEDWARAQGYDIVTLTTFRDVPWNAPFYSSLGYEGFSPSGDESGLAAVQTEEAQAGYGIRPRIAMRKAL